MEFRSLFHVIKYFFDDIFIYKHNIISIFIDILQYRLINVNI